MKSTHIDVTPVKSTNKIIFIFYRVKMNKNLILHNNSADVFFFYVEKYAFYFIEWLEYK